MIYGIINIYKEKGYTSFDVVAVLRKKLKIKKIGHTGTLDPQAEGVLPVCIGKATKVVDLLTNKNKTYAATMKLGFVTDTQDHTGTVLETKEVNVLKDEIIYTVKSFIGEYDQIPPMYSALKQNGKKLYELAREGKVVERAPRPVVFYDICDIRVTGDEVAFTVTCSKGTYIRTLCHDIGEKLGCGGHMTSLTRTHVGDFAMKNSIKLSEIDDYILDDKIESIITPIDALFKQYEAIVIDECYNKYLYNGNKLSIRWCINSPEGVLDNTYRVYDQENSFIGIYRLLCEKDDKILKPLKVFI